MIRVLFLLIDGGDDFLMLYDELLFEMHGRLEHDRDLTDSQVLRQIDLLLSETAHKGYLPLSEREALRNRLFNALRRLDVLQELLDDDSVTEIMVNGTEGIFIERRGRITKWNTSFKSRQKLEDVALRIAAGVNRTASELNPVVDARLDGGERVSIVMQPVALNGPVITIRRFPKQPITMKELILWGSISEDACRYLAILVRSRYNIFISGGTGSGKTTFLNSLASHVPPDERIITIENKTCFCCLSLSFSNLSKCLNNRAFACAILCYLLIADSIVITK